MLPRTRQRRRPVAVPMYPARPHKSPGLSQPECAKRLGISIRAVQDREYRALRKLREAIAGDPELQAALALEL